MDMFIMFLLGAVVGAIVQEISGLFLKREDGEE